MPTGFYKRTHEMYESRRGRKHSEEHRQKIRNALLGKKFPNRGKGKKLTEEHKEKIRQAKIGTKASDETIRKLRASHIGYVMPESQKKAISESNKGGNRTSFRKGQTAWNKGIKSPETSNERNYAWKGDEASYFALHAWVSRKLGKPKKCSFCGTEDARTYNWANISREYKRDLTDWVRLCVKCHSKYDRKHKKENNIPKCSSPSILRITRKIPK